MNLKVFLCGLVFAGIAAVTFAAVDPVLMRIDKHEIKVSEFEYLYQKNLEQQVNRESIDEYVDRFINYKIKVYEAERLGYDTLPRIKSELEGYKNELLQPYLIDNELQEKLVQEAYDRMTKNVNISHLMLARGKNKAEDDAQIARMDSIRNCILAGESFNDLVMKYSIDRSKANNKGEYGYISSGIFPYAFEYEAYNTPVGELSKPFLTDYGVHMIRVNGVKPDDGTVEVSHILRLFPRNNVTDSAKLAVKAQIDSIYACIQAGEDFEDLAKRLSQDKGSARNGGKLPAFGRNRMVKPFEEVAFMLPDGEISEPFETNYGYHIIKKYGHKKVGSLDDCRQAIEEKMKTDERSMLPIKSKVQQVMKELNYKPNDKLHGYLIKELNKHGQYDSTFVADVVGKSNEVLYTFGANQKGVLSDMTKMLNPKAKYASNEVAAAEIEGNVERLAQQNITDYYARNLYDLNPDYRNLMNEYRDGTLLFEVMNNEVWSKAKSDEKALEQRFNANPNKYKWDEPHFKGIMICAKNDSILNEALSYYASINNVPEDTITTALNRKFGRNIKMVRVISQRGDNEMVDNIAFAGKAVPSAYAGYPVYTRLMGRVINQPEEMADVKGLVASDYQDDLEQQWLQGLRKKYKVKIDNKILKSLKAKYK